MIEPDAFVLRRVPMRFVIAREVVVAEERVVFPLNVFVPANTLFVYVFGIVVEAFTNDCTRASV